MGTMHRHHAGFKPQEAPPEAVGDLASAALLRHWSSALEHQRQLHSLMDSYDRQLMELSNTIVGLQNSNQSKEKETCSSGRVAFKHDAVMKTLGKIHAQAAECTENTPKREEPQAKPLSACENKLPAGKQPSSSPATRALALENKEPTAASENQTPPGMQVSNCLPARSRLSSENPSSLEEMVEAVPAQLWQVVGGSEKGGIIVREQESMQSKQSPKLLSSGALVEQVALNGDRLHFKRRTGEGPRSGWISTQAGGKDLVVKSDKTLLQFGFLFGGTAITPHAMQAEPNIPGVSDLVSKGKEILGWDAIDVLMKAPTEEIQPVRVFCPLRYMLDAIGWQKLKVEKPEVLSLPIGIAGSNLGFFASLYASGILSFEDGLRLSKFWAEMSEPIEGKELLVAGIEQHKLTELCRKAEQGQAVGSLCEITQFLAYKGQMGIFLVSGTPDAVTTLKTACENAGVVRCEYTKGTVATNTPLMSGLQDTMAEFVDEMMPRVKPPKHTLWLPSCRVLRPDSDPEVVNTIIRNELITWFLRPQHWHVVITTMVDEGCARFCAVCSEVLRSWMKHNGVFKTTTCLHV
mmetsp:Transcript_132823/g.283810  ORF Transcript_132823/g.283810 Transcript_132823/m.283810 type:complete len:577 (-) Transcript_132823:62-1792(-)